MRWFIFPLVLLILNATLPSVVHAKPLVGYKTQLSQFAHNVSGTVTVVDEDTLQFDDFTYDSGGIVVKFYLGSKESDDAFKNGLPIGSDLVGTFYDGTQEAFTVDLPVGQTIDGWNAISVWCVIARVNFGSGTFALPGDFDYDDDVDGVDYLKWQRGELLNPLREEDRSDWESYFGTSSPATAAVAVVPEPSSAVLMLLVEIGAVIYCRPVTRHAST